MTKLIEIRNKDLVADSRVIANELNVEHRAVRQLIKKHQDSIEAFGYVTFEMSRTLKGRQETFCYLNEPQTTFLITLMRNSDIVVRFKEKLIDEFYRMRKALLEASMNKKNQEWLTNRQEGKLQRRETTDIIKQFVEYSIESGSKNASRYYSNISKMENKALFLIQEKFPKIRDVMNNRQLSFIKSADIIVEEAIRYGMAEGMFYKDIFKLCKARVESFADLIPRTAIPMMIEEKV